MATPGQLKLLRLILDTRELDDEVVLATRVLSRQGEMSAAEAERLIEVLLKSPEAYESDYRVGGIIRA